MARLNTTKPPKPNDPRLRPKSSLVEQSPSRNEPRDSATETKEPKKGSLGSETSTKNGILETTTRAPLQKSRSQRSGKSSGGSFDIFCDGDAASERECEKGSSVGGPRREENTKPPLNYAKVNSLLLPLPQQGRSRPTRKSELDYDKENDVAEEEVEDLYGSTTAGGTRRRGAPDRRDEALHETPGRNGSGRQLWAYREPETEGQEEEEEEEGRGADSDDNGFDSLDDFIVSDNEELSYHGGSESEDEVDVPSPPQPPPTTRRRLFRGRRPDSDGEAKEELEQPSQKKEPSLGSSRLSESTLPSLMSDSESKEVSQNGLNIAEEMDSLSLENNDPSSQLEKELCW